MTSSDTIKWTKGMCRCVAVSLSGRVGDSGDEESGAARREEPDLFPDFLVELRLMMVFADALKSSRETETFGWLKHAVKDDDCFLSPFESNNGRPNTGKVDLIRPQKCFTVSKQNNKI